MRPIIEHLTKHITDTNCNMETQTIEYKQQWDDKYLAYISGFANAQGADRLNNTKYQKTRQ